MGFHMHIVRCVSSFQNSGCSLPYVVYLSIPQLTEDVPAGWMYQSFVHQIHLFTFQILSNAAPWHFMLSCLQ